MNKTSSKFKALKKILRLITTHSIRRGVVLPFVLFAWYKGKKHKNRRGKNILILNREYWGKDLTVLSLSPDHNLHIFSPRLQLYICSSILESSIYEKEDIDVGLTKAEQESREKLKEYWVRFLKVYRRIAGLDLVMSCNWYYEQDQDLAHACGELRIPFVAIARESLNNNAYYRYMSSRLKDKRYPGSHLVTQNFKEKDFYAQLGVCERENIKVVGVNRLDCLYEMIQQKKKLQSGSEGVLFSFFYCYGLPLPDYWQGINRRYENFGWNKFFDNVHREFIGRAIENPSLNFLIKTQWNEFWYDEINQLALSAYKKSIPEIPNLTVTDKVDVYSLILNAKCIVAFNTTVVIEALAAGKKIIIPDFDECLKEEYRPFVIFPAGSSAYYSPRNPAKFTHLTQQLLEGNGPSYDRESFDKARREIVERYAYKFDGQSSRRLIAELNNIIRLSQSN